MIKRGGRDPSLSIAIEKFDDVSFEQNGSPKELIQTKHHIKSKGSLSNKSADLWKTIRNWIKLVEDTDDDYEDILFSLVTTSECKSSFASYYLKPDEEVRDIEKAINLLNKAAISSKSKELESAFNKFQNLDSQQKKALFSNVYVFDKSPTVENLRQKILDQINILVRPEDLEDVYERIQGWWLKITTQSLVDEEAPPIDYMRLRSKINDIREEYTQESLPVHFTDPLDVDRSHLGKEQKVMLKQLEIISLRENRILKAISDYFRAYKQKSKWIRNGNLFEEELKSYEKTLIDEWEREFEVMLEDFGEDETKERLKRKGKELYNLFILEKVTDRNLYIRPETSDYFIMRGFMHELSNELDIGWHPEFKERLKDIFQDTADEYVA